MPGPFSLRKRVHGALEALGHNAEYLRHLALGNRIRGELAVRGDSGRAPVVLTHGFMGTRGTMVPLSRRFQADGRATFTWSHGPLQLRSLRASASELTDRLATLREELDVPRLDLVAFSMGGLAALYALKFLGAGEHVRRIALLGTPVSGTWTGLVGVAAMGLVSPSVWQCLPTSGFLAELRDAPMPAGVGIRQIYACDDVFCPDPEPLPGIDIERDYVVLPGGHASLVVAERFYDALRDFLREPQPHVAATPWAAALAG